jgi:eukaryotic-like serine/threonine-protein kinase
MIGKTMGHYQITSQLGKGGMGEVFRAKDQKLGRDVAIKVLPEEFAKDADRVARFQREAKLLASLNHPNIAAIYGLEESGGTNFLVLELVEGQTLADRIKAGPIPVEESLKLALQIAEALEAAHEKGVIHRDLKPANIKVTPDGKVKVLDFGLAKAFAGEQAELNLSNSPTLSDMATQQGMILGTAAYMSPEQARGKAVDRRADIWAFGCLLYEMLTGQAAFQGEDVTEILAAVVKGGADLDLLPANIHPRVREAITRCLQKDLRKRYQGIADARYEIEQALADPKGLSIQPIMAGAPRKKLSTVLPWATAVIIVAAVVGMAVWHLRTPEPRRVMRFAYVLPEGRQFNQDEFGHIPLAISPDGSHFVYGTDGGLYLRHLNESDARLISGTDRNSRWPFYSPDGKWIAYESRAEGKLKKISISGGVPITLCDAKSFSGGIWCENNTIIYSTNEPVTLRVSADGGAPKPVFKAADGVHVEPQLLPNGKSILFEYFKQGPKISVWSLKSGETRELFEGESARYLPTGHIVYVLKGNLFAVPFDQDTLRVTGGPVSMIEGGGLYSVSNEGTLTFITGMGGEFYSKRSLVWVDRNGKEEPLAIPANLYDGPQISPDGKHLALTISAEGNDDIRVWDFGRKTLTRLTFDKDQEAYPLWSPDGKRIAFHATRKDSPGDVFWKSADGTGQEEQVGAVADQGLFPLSWSRDGKTMILTKSAFAGQLEIGTISMAGDHKYQPLLQGKHMETQPSISPDGRWMAYTSDESGPTEIYVRPFPEVNKGKWQVSSSGGDSPLWSRNGRELFYRSGDSVMAVAVQTEPAFKLGNSESLFRGKYLSWSFWAGHTWDISPDGKRFLMIKQSGSAEIPGKINVVVNWFEELKQRVPKK